MSPEINTPSSFKEMYLGSKGVIRLSDRKPNCTLTWKRVPLKSVGLDSEKRGPRMDHAPTPPFLFPRHSYLLLCTLSLSLPYFCSLKATPIPLVPVISAGVYKISRIFQIHPSISTLIRSTNPDLIYTYMHSKNTTSHPDLHCQLEIGVRKTCRTSTRRGGFFKKTVQMGEAPIKT